MNLYINNNYSNFTFQPRDTTQEAYLNNHFTPDGAAESMMDEIQELIDKDGLDITSTPLQTTAEKVQEAVMRQNSRGVVKSEFNYVRRMTSYVEYIQLVFPLFEDNSVENFEGIEEKCNFTKELWVKHRWIMTVLLRIIPNYQAPKELVLRDPTPPVPVDKPVLQRLQPPISENIHTSAPTKDFLQNWANEEDGISQPVPSKKNEKRVRAEKAQPPKKSKFQKVQAPVAQPISLKSPEPEWEEVVVSIESRTQTSVYKTSK